MISTEEARVLAPLYAPEVSGKHRQQLEAYKRMPDNVLFRVQEVLVPFTEFDLPGPTRAKVACSQCGQMVRDRREVIVNGTPLCQPCAHGAYFREIREMTCPEMAWSPMGSSPTAEVHTEKALGAR